MNNERSQPDPRLDLVLERIVDIPPQRVWAAWTRPEQLKKWFTPAPWTTVACEIELHPGGLFYTLMRSPEGQEFPHRGCYLEIVENQKLVRTDALGPGHRPSENSFFTAMILLEPHGKGTKYTAMHKDESGRKKHEEMGFHAGWGRPSINSSLSPRRRKGATGATESFAGKEPASSRVFFARVYRRHDIALRQAI